MISLPIVDEAIKELNWVAERGAILVAMHSSDSGYSRYASEWEGAATGHLPFKPDAFRMLSSWRPIADSVGSWACHGALYRHPDLKVAVIENGASWLPTLLAELNLWKKMPDAFPSDPAEEVRRRIYIDHLSGLSTEEQWMDAASGAFHALGIGSGDRVAIWSPNSADWIVAAYGVLAAGGVIVPVSTRLGDEFPGRRASELASGSAQKVTGMDSESMSATTTIDAPAEAIFAVLADPSRHASIDGTGWVCESRDGKPLTEAGQVFRMNMYHPNHPDGNYRVANRVQVFDPPRAISWEPGTDADDDASVVPGGWVWRYDLVPAGPSGTRVTLSYDWSAVSDLTRERIGFPPFPQAHLDNSLAHLAELATV